MHTVLAEVPAQVGAAGLVSFFAASPLDRRQRGVQVFDAMGLAVFCVTGASKATDFGLGPAQAVILGAITGIGGGMLRDILLSETPTVLRRELYAIPALLGAGVVVGAQSAGSSNPLFPLLAACLCFGTRMIGLRYGLDAPTAPAEPAVIPPTEIDQSSRATPIRSPACRSVWTLRSKASRSSSDMSGSRTPLTPWRVITLGREMLTP